jgi:hypothetical protein
VAALQVGVEEQPADDGDPPGDVEEAVRDERRARPASVVEVVPVQELVEHGLVDEGGQAHPDEDAGPDRTGAEGGDRHGGPERRLLHGRPVPPPERGNHHHRQGGGPAALAV